MEILLKLSAEDVAELRFDKLLKVFFHLIRDKAIPGRTRSIKSATEDRQIVLTSCAVDPQTIITEAIYFDGNKPKSWTHSGFVNTEPFVVNENVPDTVAADCVGKIRQLLINHLGKK